MSDHKATDALTATLNRVAEGFGWQAVWGDTGGGCTAIVISRRDDDNTPAEDGCTNYPSAVIMVTDNGSQAPMVHAGEYGYAMGEVHHVHGQYGCAREDYHTRDGEARNADELADIIVTYVRERLADIVGTAACDVHPDRPAIATDKRLLRMCDECFRALDI